MSGDIYSQYSQPQQTQRPYGGGGGPPMQIGVSPIAGIAQPSGMNIKATLKPEDSSKALAWQGWLQAGGMAANTLIAGFNYGLQSESISAQKDVMKSYYGAQEKIAGFQQQVAIRQLDVQETAVITQSQMHRNQLAHEERIARLEGSTQAKLARIQEDGKNTRARTLSMTDAFKSSREDWFYGRA
jgi:hypothetical protein